MLKIKSTGWKGIHAHEYRGTFIFINSFIFSYPKMQNCAKLWIHYNATFRGS